VTPAISVIIPCYNGEAYLAEALESVAAQTLQPAQTIVVDDGSTDGSAAVARSFPWVTLVSQENRGLPAARNAGLAVATGDLLAFLDADDAWEPQKLARQAAYLAEHPEVPFVFAYHRYRIEDPEALPPFLRHTLTLESERSTLPSAWLVRREAMDLVGHFRTGLTISDDLDWLMRASDLGLRPGTVEEPLVWRRIHASNLSLDARETQRELLGILRESLRRKRESGTLR